MKNGLVSVSVGLMLTGISALASAGTVNLSGFTSMGGKNATVSNAPPGNPTFNNTAVSAGALGGTVSGFGPSQSWVNNGSFVTYCVEFTEYFQSGPFDYSLVSGSSYAFGSNPATTADSAAISLRLGKLFTYVNGLGTVDTAAETAAVQLAVWEIIYEKPTGELLNVSVGNGNFSLASSSANLASLTTDANAYLSGSEFTVNTYGVYVLTRAQNQDWIALREGGGNAQGNIPEPGSVALSLAALGALAFVRRRRSSLAQA